MISEIPLCTGSEAALAVARDVDAKVENLLEAAAS